VSKHRQKHRAVFAHDYTPQGPRPLSNKNRILAHTLRKQGRAKVPLTLLLACLGRRSCLASRALRLLGTTCRALAPRSPRLLRACRFRQPWA